MAGGGWGGGRESFGPSPEGVRSDKIGETMAEVAHFASERFQSSIDMRWCGVCSGWHYTLRLFDWEQPSGDTSYTSERLLRAVILDDEFADRSLTRLIRWAAQEVYDRQVAHDTGQAVLALLYEV